MKNLLVLILIVSFTACKENKDSLKKNAGVDLQKPDVDFSRLELDFNKWWAYHYNNISLSSKFIAINDKSEIISKNDFLQALSTGNFIPLKLITSDSLKKYKLFKLDSSADKSIRTTIKNTSAVIYKHFKMEGTKFPDFSFMALNGTEYNNDNIKGKTVILKCWFINCKPCIAEFPELNLLVERNKDTEDVLFISLAMDSKADLDKFLAKKTFKYETIPNQREFMDKVLNVQQYPTHFIVNKYGLIEKVVNKSSELISHLNDGRILGMKESENLPPPPPPGPAK